MRDPWKDTESGTKNKVKGDRKSGLSSLSIHDFQDQVLSNLFFSTVN